MSLWIDYFFVFYFALLNGVYALLVFFSGLELFERHAARVPELDGVMLSEWSTPPVTIITPAYNEGRVVAESVRSFQQLEYPHLRILVVNDGSTDDTMAELHKALDLREVDLVVRDHLRAKPIRGIYRSANDQRVWVVDKENGGKADALNVGLNVCRTPLVCCVDADTIIARHALLRMVEPFVFDDGEAVAVGGTVRLANGCKVRDGQIQEVRIPDQVLARYQIIEYLRAFLFSRMGLNRLGGNLIVSGAFGMFRRSTLVDIGGYRTDSVGEDMEIVVRLHRFMGDFNLPYKIVHIPDPVCYTEAPVTVSELSRQRDRWQRGLADSVWRHIGMLFNPKYGLVGMVVFPFFVFVELLGPIIEFVGYTWFFGSLVLGRVSFDMVVMYFVAAVLLGFLVSAQSLVLDDLNFHFFPKLSQRLRLLATAFLENFWYRQMTLFFRVRGMIRFILGDKNWGEMRRLGFERSGT